MAKVKKAIAGMMVVVGLAVSSISSSPAHAAADKLQIKIDGVVISSDAGAEVKNNHTMVPLRVISENLGAKVAGTNTEIILTKDKTQIKLKPDSGSVTINGVSSRLDVKPYLKNGRIMVPLRFLSEAFGCQVAFKNPTITVNSAALVINNVKVKAVQQEYHMIMGGVVQQITGNAYNNAIYDIFNKNMVNKAGTPPYYSWTYSMDNPGSYYKEAQFDFLDEQGNSVKEVDIYTLINAASEHTAETYPEILIHDVAADQWYLFSEAARKSIFQLIDTAAKNGFLQIISNTIA